MMITSDVIDKSETAPRRFKIASPEPKAKVEDGNTNLNHITGFGPLSRITTSFGLVYAQALREGDLVRTQSGDFIKIAAINRITLGHGYLKYHPGALPIVIRAGAFAVGLPVADLTLAPFQKLSQSQRFMGGRPIRAVDAIGRAHVYRKPEDIITYTVFHCGKRATVLCEGVWVETAP
jgi:hypothetical protein